MISQLITGYQNEKGEILLVPKALTKRGSMGVNQVHRHSSPARAELGRVARTMTRFCEESLLDTAVPIPVLTVTGAKTWGSFAKKWHSIDVSFSSEITLTPYERDSIGRYFPLMKESIVLPNDATDVELGESMLQSFARCRNKVR